MQLPTFKKASPQSCSSVCRKADGNNRFVFHVLLHDQKYQKSSKTFPLRYLPTISRLPKRKQYTPSCANISSEPSDCRQRQERRLKCTGCLFDFALCPFPLCRSALSVSAVSAHRLHARPPHLYMRAWNQRIRESARLLRVMCSHAWYR